MSTCLTISICRTPRFGDHFAPGADRSGTVLLTAASWVLQRLSGPFRPQGAARRPHRATVAAARSAGEQGRELIKSAREQKSASDYWTSREYPLPDAQRGEAA
jgi:hypothetical protein